MTRLAASDRALWADVLEANADHLVGPIDALVRRLETARDALASNDVDAALRALQPEELSAAVR